MDSFLRKSFDTTTQSGNMKLKEQPVTENQQLLIYSVCLQGRDCIRWYKVDNIKDVVQFMINKVNTIESWFLNKIIVRQN